MIAAHLRGERSTGMETFIPAPAIREICEIRGQNNRRFQVEDSSLKDAKALERIAPGRAQHAPGERGVPLESAPRAIGLNASGVPHRRDHGFQVPRQHRRRMGDVADRDGFPQGRRGAGKTGRGSRRSRCCKPNLHSFAPSRLRANLLKARECFARSREDAKDLGGGNWAYPSIRQGSQERCELREPGCGIMARRWMGGGHPRQVPARWFDMESPVEGNPWPREQRSTRRGAVAKPPEVLSRIHAVAFARGAAGRAEREADHEYSSVGNQSPNGDCPVCHPSVFSPRLRGSA